MPLSFLRNLPFWEVWVINLMVRHSSHRTCSWLTVPCPSSARLFLTTDLCTPELMVGLLQLFLQLSYFIGVVGRTCRCRMSSLWRSWDYFRCKRLWLWGFWGKSLAQIRGIISVVLATLRLLLARICYLTWNSLASNQQLLATMGFVWCWFDEILSSTIAVLVFAVFVVFTVVISLVATSVFLVLIIVLESESRCGDRIFVEMTIVVVERYDVVCWAQVRQHPRVALCRGSPTSCITRYFYHLHRKYTFLFPYPIILRKYG
jgi:hypothetical protein